MKVENYGIVFGAVAICLALLITAMSAVFLHSVVVIAIGIVLAVLGVVLIIFTVRQNRKKRRRR